MTYPGILKRSVTYKAVAMLLIVPAFSAAQVPVDDDGNVIGTYEPQSDNVQVSGAQSTAENLQELVGPVALYPDDLLAIVLPASAYPLQIVAAARFLEALENDPNLKPNPDWDDSVVALINYPEVIELMNNDLDWTYRLGEAVVAQQADVVAAVEAFRDRAYTAGNLKSDKRQTISQNNGVIEISPVADDVIYVPYYEPRRVVVYQPRPVYYYHPRAYPVYYYPYAAHHYFDRGYFWGLTTAFSIGWYTDSLHVFHHSYHGHPYYGHNYYRHHRYRRPSISIYNTTYASNTRHANSRGGYANRHRDGDRWQARSNRRVLTRRSEATRVRQPNQRSVGVNRQRRDSIRFSERENRPVTVARNERRRNAGQIGDTTRRRPATPVTRTAPRESREFTFRERNQGSSNRSIQSRRSINRGDAENVNAGNRARQRRQQSNAAPVRVSPRRDGANSRSSVPAKRAEPRRREQQPTQAPQSKSQERSSRSEAPAKRAEKRSSRSRNRRR